jgi:hypothetical protein
MRSQGGSGSVLSALEVPAPRLDNGVRDDAAEIGLDLPHRTRAGGQHDAADRVAHHVRRGHGMQHVQAVRAFSHRLRESSRSGGQAPRGTQEIRSKQAAIR